MTDFDATVLNQHPEWRSVLEAYRALQEQADAGQKQADGEVWLPRLSRVEGVPSDKMAAIHGKLIALGWLRFHLQGRNDGVLYRLSSEGLRALQSTELAGDETAELMQSA
ncbi:MAG TPA: hypothetical protein EYP14_16100 [Planctomycetaceae bacterium]|nr:hypothetical protein [Planctomycetaceae bacterium]